MITEQDIAEEYEDVILEWLFETEFDTLSEAIASEGEGWVEEALRKFRERA